MLHENPLMSDINVDHWRNLQDLLLDSAKEKKRIIVIHDDGEIQKFVHSDRAEIDRSVVNRITRPQEDARRIFEANAGQSGFRRRSRSSVGRSVFRKGPGYVEIYGGSRRVRSSDVCDARRLS